MMCNVLRLLPSSYIATQLNKISARLHLHQKRTKQTLTFDKGICAIWWSIRNINKLENCITSMWSHVFGAETTKIFVKMMLSRALIISTLISRNDTSRERIGADKHAALKFQTESEGKKNVLFFSWEKT